MEEKKYKRDKRSPIPKNSTTSKIMSAIKSKNTKPELILRKALWQAGIKGYRLHVKNLAGKPDIAFANKKTAIFINGCFWHRCPTCNFSLPKSNTEYWQNKFSRNQERDIRKIVQLNSLGWKTIIFWECQIKSDLEYCINNIRQTLDN